MIFVRMQLYIYSQVIPFGSVFTGKPYQFPLLWESTFVCWVMIPAGVLLYRDDTGRTQAEKLAQRIRTLRPFRARPALATFTVMFAILNVAYFCYGASFGVIRATGAATSVACPWPFPESKVYDPQGFYAEAGQPGPYMAGIWDGWESAQSGRPNVATNPDGRCSPKNVDRRDSQAPTRAEVRSDVHGNLLSEARGKRRRSRCRWDWTTILRARISR